jgi:uncharacterized protein YndB with AHSA1/START domain
MESKTITVEALVDAPIAKVWDYWIQPEHIMHWDFASDDWEVPNAENDVRLGGAFKITMGAKDKSEVFDLTGVYTFVKEHEQLDSELSDGRRVSVLFTEKPDGVLITQTFDMEHENSEELQRNGWQAILDNFKKYTEKSK